MTFDDLAADWLKGTPWLEAHTSGSTGTPKEVRLPRHFVEESAKRTNAFFGIGKDDVLYCPLAADYIAGKMMWIRAHLAGARFVAEAPSNRPMHQLPADVKEIALLAVVPSQLKYIPEATNLPPIRAIIVGGAPTDDDLKMRCRDWSKQTGTKIFETYGMTETASHIALREISAERPTPCFRTLPGITVSVDDADCLAIHIPGWPDTQTRDVARVYSPTEFEILGRADGAIISGGLKVLPEDVERRIAGVVHHPAMIAGEKDAKWGEHVVLYLETGGQLLEEDEIAELQRKLRELLRPHERPARIECVPLFERTESGKLKRRQRISQPNK